MTVYMNAGNQLLMSPASTGISAILAYASPCGIYELNFSIYEYLSNLS
jgi:hypothetical protein